MSKDFPIIKFYERNQDNAKTAGGGTTKKPRFTLSGEELVNRGHLLLDQLQEVVSNWDNDIVKDVPKVIEVNYIDEAKAKSHQSKIIDLFKNYKKTTQIGAEANNKIILQIASTNHIKEVISKMESFEDYDVVISAINEIHKYEPQVLESDNQEYNITFWNFIDNEDNEKVFREVGEILSKEKIEYKEDSFGGGESVFEVSNITMDKLEFIKKLPVKHIEPTEKTEAPFHDVDLEVGELKKLEYDENEFYPVLGLLDSGIEINEFTRDWVTRGNGCSYSEVDLDKTHGTYIASLLIHGDYFNNTSDFSMNGCKIIDVPIVPAEPIDTKELVKNIENGIIKNPDIKIWNLSVSIKGEVKEQEFSTFAKELDRIQEENNVLIFKSAGNDPSFFIGGEAGKLSLGADSIRAITVGSVNRGTDAYSITREGFPSPYSRIGRGPSFIIKPELVHFGGDLYSLNDAPQSSTDYECIDGLGVSVNQKRMQQPGTSFSTPKVAKTAAEIAHYLESDDLLMIKALLVHYSNHSPKLDLEKDEILKKMGFGRPLSSAEIVSNDDAHSVTLMMRGRLEKGKEIDIMDFPYPKALIENGLYKGRMILTLVSNPYLRGDLASEYCQTNLELKFGTFDRKEDVEGTRAQFNAIKRIDSRNVLLRRSYSKRLIRQNSDYNYERTLIEYGDKYYPVKKYACDLNEFTEGNKKYLDADRKWYVHLKGEYRDYINLENIREHEAFINGEAETDFENLGIDYCLFISIYDSEKQTNVYDSVVNELDNQGFNYEQVNIENEISIETDTTLDI